jgi:hypothetical protein
MTYAHAGGLEHGFRRLLRWYPADYRAAREEEMLATLMETSVPGQESPTLRDRLDLAVGAARAHLRRPGTAVRNGVAAAALPAALLAIGVCATRLVTLLMMAVLRSWQIPSAAGPDYAIGPAILKAGLPVVVAVVLAAAVLVRRPAVLRATAAALALGMLGTTVLDKPDTGFTRETAYAVGLLALFPLVAPAITGVRRRVAAALAVVLVGGPVTSVALLDAEYVSAVRSAHSMAVGTPTDAVLPFAASVVIGGVLVGAGVLSVGVRPGGVLGSGLFIAAALPGLALWMEAFDVRWFANWPLVAAAASVVVLPSVTVAIVAGRRARWRPAAA